MCIVCASQGLSSSWGVFEHDLSVHPAGTTWELGFSAASTEGMESATAAGVTVGGTGVQNIDALISGTRWSGAISYSFPDARGDYQITYAEADNGFGSVSLNQQQAARYILEGSSSAVGGPRITLTALEQFTNAFVSDAGFGSADIRIAKSSNANPTAYAYYPSSSYYGGDVWFGTSYDYSNPRVGNYQFATMMHELGHALGLKHGHQLGGVSNVALTADRDSLEFSVMTYRSYVGHSGRGYTNETFGYPQTFMMYDIAALQQLYGANFDINSDNTLYQWSPTTGETFVNGVAQGAPGGGSGGSANRIFLTIWDGGGTDTYDFLNFSTNLIVDLRPGGWSSLSETQTANLGNGNYARANVFNALQHYGDQRSLIENAVGGSGADSITGNDVSNRLRGSAGNDLLCGLAGNDLLDGGDGIDTAVFSGHSSQFDWNKGIDGSWNVVSDSDGLDFLVGVESLQFDDTIISLDASVASLAASDSAADDFNNDGRSDFVWQHSNGQVGIALAGSRALAGPNPGSAWKLRDAADFNGDGNADLLWQNENGQAAVWLMNGLNRIGDDIVGPNPGSAWKIKAAADFDGDGKADILWQHENGQAAVWTMNGLNRIADGPVGPNPGSAWKIRDAADFKGDGKADILWQHENGQGVVWMMDGLNRIADDAAGPNPGSAWKIRDAADFDGDGKADLLWQNDSGLAAIWTMDGFNRKVDDVVGINPGNAWKVVGGDDYNADGKADIAWQDTTGQTALWAMDGLQVIASVTIAGAAPDWSLL